MNLIFFFKKKKEWNVFEGFFTNSIFLGIMFFTLVMQFLIVEFGGEFTSTTSLTLNEWLFCIGVGSLSLPVGNNIFYFLFSFVFKKN